MSVPKVRIVEVLRRERMVKLRLPFRYGAVTLREAPQAFIRVRIHLHDGRETWGQAAELMAPKWFDKSPELSNAQNFDQLRAALGRYAEALMANGEATAFGHFAQLYQPHIDACGEAGLNPLVAGYGPALIDRAVLDALARAHGLSMAEALRRNLAGLRPQQLISGFEDFDFDAFLASLRPLETLHARHTVGMVDPLTSADQSADEQVGDGLPETLEEVIGRYGHTYFKIKVGGDRAADVDRLIAIARVLDSMAAPYHVSLDGNEQYDDVDGVVALLSAMREHAALDRFCRSIIFVEQPIQRATALDRDVRRLAESFPVIIDESDCDLSTFPAARTRGYTGVSSKNCKGFHKSLINLARCRMWSADDRRDYFITAEDLSCQAGVAVQQDLALVALLGISHVERNGHHYGFGMAGASAAEQAAFTAAHPGLYADAGGRATLRIEKGQIDVRSLQCPGFGTTVEPDWSQMTDMPDGADW